VVGFGGEQAGLRAAMAAATQVEYEVKLHAI
jgi:hypothetical protein